MGKLKYTIITYGCQMNTADSEEMSRPLEARGYRPTSALEEADLVLVNTCTVRQHAEHRALSLLGRLKEWKKAKEGRLIVLTGCAAERIKEQVSWRLPQVDLTVGAKEIERFGERLDEFLKERFDWASETTEAFSPPPAVGEDQGGGKIPGTAVPPILTFPHGGGKELNAQATLASSPVAYITIMRGCNYNCSYCIVPSVRGREIYRPVEKVLEEVQAGVEAGAKEVLLLGQTVNSYESDGCDFAGLLKKVDALPGVRRIRYMSPHPHYMDKPTINTLAEIPAVCEHVHLPVQSGSDRILKNMKRNYTRSSYLEAVATLRKKIPGISITTDVIVGFPGETEKDFEETLGLVDEADFDSAYCFKYSPRPGTLSASWPDDVPQKTKEERLARLLELTEAQGKKNAAKLMGTLQEVLIEETDRPPHPRRREGNHTLPTRNNGVKLSNPPTGDEGGIATGRTRGNWKVSIPLRHKDALKPGDLVEVKITSADGRALEGAPASGYDAADLSRRSRPKGGAGG